jgi:hypothetical protein
MSTYLSRAHTQSLIGVERNHFRTARIIDELKLDCPSLIDTVDCSLGEGCSASVSQECAPECLAMVALKERFVRLQELDVVQVMGQVGVCR